jgi:cation diffusion facilitator CzcD-associated flavoprotein CzcO
MATPDRVPPRYCIIGAGYAGLAAAKGFTDAGLDYDQFEAKEQVGGNWFDGVYDSTTMISSKDATAYADHPMPADYPMFPSRAQMLAYLQSYAVRFGLDRRIRLNTLVDAVTPLDPTGRSGWKVRLASGEEHEYAGVVVANGHYWKVNIPEYPGEFAGKQLHSKFYNNPDDVEGTRVLVVGAGNSGCDLAVESSNAFGSADLSMRSGYWFLPKTMWGIPISALDTFYQPLWLQRAALKTALRMTVGSYERYGLPKPNHDLFDKDVTVNSTMMYAVQHGRVRPRPEISHYEGKRVHFVDGTSDEFDTILWATGFHTDFPFLDRGLFTWENGQPKLISHLLPPGLANLYLWGNVAPRAGVGRTLTQGGRLIADLVVAQRTLDRPLSELVGAAMKPQSSMLSGQGELLLLIRSMRRLLRVLHTADGLTRGNATNLISRAPLPSRAPTSHPQEDSMSLPQPHPDRPAVVTGASSGIGEALADGLARRGHALIIVARREDRLRDLAARISAKYGTDVEVFPCDLSDPESRAKLAADLAGREISILCNNAGYAT